MVTRPSKLFTIPRIPIAVFAVLILTLVSARPSSAWKISSYNVNLDIQSDSKVVVTETITADFTEWPRHGIYRNIPFSARGEGGKSHRLHIRFMGVTDQDGNPVHTEVFHKLSKMHIHIGDPETLLEDIHTYVIRYEVSQAINYFPEYDELYWNVTGNDWEVPIDNASCVVTLPSDSPQGLMMNAYTGSYGSKTDSVFGDTPDLHTANFWMIRTLKPGEGLAVVVAWPKGMIAKPSFTQNLESFARQNGILLFPTIFLLAFLGLGWRVGRDPNARRSVQVCYDAPDNLLPAEIGTLIDEKLEMRDISATIIDLAVRGFVHIEVESEEALIGKTTDYIFELRTPSAEIDDNVDLTKFERKLLRAIFVGCDSIRLSDLIGTFHVQFEQLEDLMYDSLIEKGYFRYRPDFIRQGYQTAGFLAFLAGDIGCFIALALDLPITTLEWAISVAACGLILAVGSKSIPRKTRKGAAVLQSIHGFEEYILRAEKSTILQQERQGSFNKYMPYAVAFGLAENWARAFDGLDAPAPDWFATDDGYYTQPLRFAKDLNFATTEWSNTMSQPLRTSHIPGNSGIRSGVIKS